MSHVFDTAVCMAQKMTAPKPKLRIMVNMAGGGGLSSLQKNILIQGQPHELSYITPGEGDLLKQLGGSGRTINGIPAYYMGGDFGQGWGEAEAAADDAASADDSISEEDFSRGLGQGKGWGLGYGRGGLGWALDISHPEDPEDWSPDPLGQDWGPKDPKGGKRGLKTTWHDILGPFLSYVVNALAVASPLGPTLSLASKIGTGKTLGATLTGYKGPEDYALGRTLDMLGLSKSEGMDIDEMSTDVHDVDHPSFDEDTMSEEDLLPDPEKEKEDDWDYRVKITDLWDNDEDEDSDEESWWDRFTSNEQNMLKQIYGDDVAEKGLPDIMAQVYGNRGTG